MAAPVRDPQPATEQIHLPADSLNPVGVALSIALIMFGVFTTWIIVVVGILVGQIPLRRWIRQSRAETSELPLGIR